MCTVCGCENADHQHHLHEADPHHRDHAGPGGAIQMGGGAIHMGGGAAGLSVAGLSQGRIIAIERDILGKNDGYAGANRERFRAGGVLAVNLLSSPGAGKTSLLVRAITDLRARLPIAVIEGDQQTSNDAERIRATGVQAIQINTGRGCHLDAHMVGHAFDHISLAPGGLLCIENVGNLVCPAAFDLSEASKIVLLSVTEGEDKPLKYPDMFAAADLLLLTKFDLLPYLDFNLSACFAAALRVNPSLRIITVSARTGEGMAELYCWIDAQIAAPRAVVRP
jgi:hydrogenase nickel incorporation protein HypB